MKRTDMLGPWTVGRVRWLGSSQWVSMRLPKDGPLKGGGWSGNIFEAVFVAVYVAVVAIRISLGVTEYLIKLAARPLRMRLQPSARAAGWGFEVSRAAPTVAGPEARPVTTCVRLPARPQAHRVREQLVALLPSTVSLDSPRVVEALRAASATTRNV